MADEASAALIKKISKRKISAGDIFLLQIAFTEALKSVGLDRLNRQIEKLQNETKRSPAQDKLMERLNEDRRALSDLFKFRPGSHVPKIPFPETVKEAKQASEIANDIILKLTPKKEDQLGRPFLASPEDFFSGSGIRAFFNNLEGAEIFTDRLKDRYIEALRPEPKFPEDTLPLEFDPGPTPLEPLEIDPRLKKEDEGASISGDGIVRMASLDAGLVGADQAFDALDSTLEKVDKSMTRVFTNMAVGGASAADELSRIFASLDSDILGSLGGLGSLISKFLGGGPASFLGSLFGLAGGGTAQPGTPILVGERGPEIFLPSGPGRVLNAHNTARAMGGAGAGGQQPLVVQQTINFSTDVKNTVRAEVLNALPLATNIAARQVSDMLRGIRR